MRKTIFALLACAILVSCAKSDKNEPIVEKELLPVSFSVGFSKEVVDYRSLTTARGTEDFDYSVYDFDYLVYEKESGRLYKKKRFEYSDGVIKDELPEGEYIILFIETYGWDIIEHYSINALEFSNYFYYYNMDYAMNAFYSCRLDVKVTKGAENSNRAVMQRMVGKVEVVLDDVIPDNVNKITMWISPAPVSILYNVDADFYHYDDSFSLKESTTMRFNVSETDKISNGYTISYTGFENIVTNGDRVPMTLKLTAYRERTPAEEGLTYVDLVVAKKTISNVNVEKNKTVIYTGKLFDELTPPNPGEKDPSSFSVSINSEWGDVINERF